MYHRACAWHLARSLFLNVWTPPGARKGSKVPVMIWLYGGGFQQGASSHPEYNGQHLARKGELAHPPARPHAQSFLVAFGGGAAS